jgi:hypothetical protein
MTDAQTVVIPISEHESLEGNLTLPADAWGAVLFAHGSGSSRHSPQESLCGRSSAPFGFGNPPRGSVDGERRAQGPGFWLPAFQH